MSDYDATIHDQGDLAHIADLNGIMDTMRENAVDREQRIAELEARNEVQRVHLEEQIERIAELEAKATADRKYMDEAEARIAELEAEQAEPKNGVIRHTYAFDLSKDLDPTDRVFSATLSLPSVQATDARIAELEAENAELCKVSDKWRDLFTEAEAERAALNARLAYLTVDCDEYVFKDGRCYQYEQDPICPREPRCHDKDRSSCPICNPPNPTPWPREGGEG